MLAIETIMLLKFISIHFVKLSRPIYSSNYYFVLLLGTPYNYADYISINSTSGEVFLLQPVCYNDIQRFDLEIKVGCPGHYNRFEAYIKYNYKESKKYFQFSNSDKIVTIIGEKDIIGYEIS